MAAIATLAEVEMGEENRKEEMDRSNITPGKLARSGNSLHRRSREMVVDLSQALTQKMQNSTVKKMHKRQIAGAVCKEVCDTLKICKKTYYQILKENTVTKETGKKLRTPGKSRPRTCTATSVDSFDKDAIRRKIYQLYAEGKFPTVATLYKYASQELKFTGSQSSFHNFMKSELGFKYECVNGRKIFMEMHRVNLARVCFLEAYKECVEAKQNIVFLGQTWVWKNHNETKESGESKRVQNKKGLVLLHAGGDAGFIKDCLLLFVSKNGIHHRDMDVKIFTIWFQEKLLMNIPPNSVIVLDNASYNSERVEKCPTTTSTKAEMLAWLQSKGIFDVTSETLKVHIYELVKQHKPSAARYVIDEMASNAGHQVLRLPAYHHHYNPIELIWEQVKKNVAANNTTFKMDDVEQHTINAVNLVTALDWQGCIKHTDEIYNADLIREEETDDHVDQLLTRVRENGESDTTSDSEQDEM